VPYGVLRSRADHCRVQDAEQAVSDFSGKDFMGERSVETMTWDAPPRRADAATMSLASS
jgi:hypothetical protein